ncbi:hypothetical protein BS78_08G017600 [Paspalum vaginatum]|nr:hypothetical protein BS78_08G017600 [Paspalum vaginatum]
MHDEGRWRRSPNPSPVCALLLACHTYARRHRAHAPAARLAGALTRQRKLAPLLSTTLVGSTNLVVASTEYSCFCIHLGLVAVERGEVEAAICSKKYKIFFLDASRYLYGT